MENCPDYMAVWLGLGRIGVTVALINTNLTGDALAHSISTVAPRYVITGAGLAANLLAVRARLAPDLACWVNGADAADLPRLDTAVAALAADALESEEFRAPTLVDRAL